MPDIKDGAGMGQSGAGIGPYNPVNDPNVGEKYYKAVQKDLTKRYGKNGSKKNPPSKRGNKIVT